MCKYKILELVSYCLNCFLLSQIFFHNSVDFILELFVAVICVQTIHIQYMRRAT